MEEQALGNDSDKETEGAVEISDDEIELPEEKEMADQPKEHLSFSDKVRGKPRAKVFDQGDRFGALDDNEGLIQVFTKDSWPAIRTSPKLREALHDKWKDCLVVKLLGRNIVYKTLHAKVVGLWNPKGDFELIELGEGFFIAKFYLDEDLRYVLEEGPWVIFGHYLTVRRWRPDFRPSEAVIDSTAAWIRFP